MKVAVVGAGPAGSLLAYHLARDGATVHAFDASHPREKPCGGGLTTRALALLPPAPPGDPLPARWVEECRFQAGREDWVDVRLDRPVAVAARRELDAWMLRRAVAAGAVHVPERVVRIDDSGGLGTSSGRDQRYDVVVGADGASSLVRRTFLGPLVRERLTMAVGWFATGTSPMCVSFVPGLAGYLWLFPRPDHVGVGICAPLGAPATRELIGTLEAEIARTFPALTELEGGRYAHTIPSPTVEPQSILEAGGSRWALVGDAAGLADPITGEGIGPALRSAVILADALREDGSPARYPSRLLNELGRELLKAASLRSRFFAPGFARRMVRYSSWSPTVRGILADLVLGDQGYVGLRRRLTRALPRFLWESAIGRMFTAA